MRYIVCVMRESGDSLGAPYPGSMIQLAPVLCDDRGQAEAYLARAFSDDELDWSVWEVVDGRCVQRSVVFKDGRPEVQS